MGRKVDYLENGMREERERGDGDTKERKGSENERDVSISMDRYFFVCQLI